MRTGARGDLPAGLETLRRRFDRWRRTRKRGSPTPDRLWKPAVQAAGAVQEAVPGLELGPAQRGAAGHGVPRVDAGRRLGTNLRASGLFRRDLRGPPAPPGHLLPGRQLGPDGPHHGPGQGRPDAPAQSVDQAGAGLPVVSQLSLFTIAGVMKKKKKQKKRQKQKQRERSIQTFHMLAKI